MAILNVEKHVYTEKDIQEGTVLTVVDNNGYSFWTVGKDYVVEKDSDNELFIRHDDGRRTGLLGILSRLNGKGKSRYGNATLKIVRQPEPNNVEWFEGLELECVKFSYQSAFTPGKTYIVENSGSTYPATKLRIYSNNGIAYFKGEIDSLSEQGIVEFKVKESSKTIHDLNKLTFEDLQKFVELSSEMQDKQDELEYHETHTEELKQALESLMNDVKSLFK